MTNSTNTIEVKVERTIPAPADEVYDAWLNPKVPGNPWSMAEKLIFNPEVDGFFYWRIQGTPHYGRFTELERSGRIQHTWMSPSTLGKESTVTITLTPQGDHTLMTLVHSDLPDTPGGKGHQDGWNFFLDQFFKSYVEAKV